MAGFCFFLLAVTFPFVAGRVVKEDDNFMLYSDWLDDSHEEEAESCPCRNELSHWDKAFVMLEDSQMRQNMLLHSVDETLAGELKAMRSELHRALAQPTGTCGHAHHHPADTASARLTKLAELRHEGMVKWQQENAKKLQEVFLLVLGVHDRIGAPEEQLENAGPSGMMPGSDGEGALCPTLIEELQQTRAELRTLRLQLPARPLVMSTEAPPAGCRRALSFATHLKGMQASILLADNRDLLAFTACIWAKPSGAAEDTVLFSYCTKGNGTEFQLYLSRGSVQFSVGGREVDGHAGPSGKWTHYCGIWDGESGNATLMVDGRAVASRNLSDGPHAFAGRGGAVLLGHGSTDCRAGRSAREPTPFAGKLTGFNLWDTASTEMEVGLLLRSNGCDVKGNVVGWGVSQVTVGTGVLFH
ncbi:pentraxin-related protein PTX3-like [Heterodontus francisci]|uniref:pentraxin-related protein PTX3-like n=1 Tax=Heterodontus francisci TaxID=7792 RepID=UPI00355C1450